MQKDDSEKTELTRHPLTVVLVAFVLSGVLGTLFSNWISGRQSEIEQLRLAAESRKAAVQNLSRYVYERRARAEMLASSFRRGASKDEIRERKKSYDETYVKWNSNHQANLFLVRDVLQEDQYSYFEQVVEFLLVGQIFAPLDRCLTLAYDAALRDDDPNAILNSCEVGKLLQQALDCGYAITDELYKLSGGSTNQTAAAREISSRCPDTFATEEGRARADGRPPDPA
jgi:hypothetical protein